MSERRRMLDLFCGRWGWSKAFAARGWECVGVDLKEPDESPAGCYFEQGDVLRVFNWSSGDGGFCLTDGDGNYWPLGKFDFVCASSPCEQFSLWGMRHFFPNPPYPALGIRLFNHTRELLWNSGVPWVMENVRAAQKFVGVPDHACGPFVLWGTGIPPLMPGGIKKGLDMSRDPITGKRALQRGRRSSYNSKARERDKAETATIPPELANCVADYAERLLEQKESGIVACHSQASGGEK